MLQVNPKITLSLSLVFFTKMPLLGSKMQSHVIILSIDGINAIKQCHLYYSFFYKKITMIIQILWCILNQQ